MPFLVGYATPQDYGAAGNGVADDTTAVQAAINAVSAAGGGTLFFPEGTYKISSALTLASFVTLLGVGSGVSVISQTSTTANGLTGVDLTNITLSQLSVNGPGSGSGVGVNLTTSVNADVTYLDFSDIRVASFGSHGINLQSPIVSRFSRVLLFSNGGDGWHVFGSGTSCHWNACYALSHTAGIGYHLISLAYSSLSGCASDSNVDGYELTSCGSVSLMGCGAESSTTDGYILSGGAGNSLVSCFVFGNNHYGVHVTNSEANATISGLLEHSPAGGAVNCVITDSGTSAVVINENVITADSYAAGTTVQLSPTNTAIFPMEASFSNATSAFKFPGAMISQPTATTNTILSSNLAGTASFDNFRILGSGTMAFGPGTTARDVQVARTAIGVLSLTNPVTTHGAVEIVDGNVVVGGTAVLGDNGVGEIQVTNASTVPTTNPTGGALLYSRSGGLLSRDPNGAVYSVISGPETAATTNALAESVPRTQVSTSSAFTSGNLLIQSVFLPAGVSVGHIGFGTGTTAGVTMTHWWAVLLDNTYKQQAHSADQTSGAIAASTWFSLAMAAPFVTTYSGTYYLGLMIAATTMPTILQSGTTPAVQFWTGTSAPTPVPNGLSSTGQTTPGTDGTTVYATPSAASAPYYMYALV